MGSRTGAERTTVEAATVSLRRVNPIPTIREVGFLGASLTSLSNGWLGIALAVVWRALALVNVPSVRSSAVGRGDRLVIRNGPTVTVLDRREIAHFDVPTEPGPRRSATGVHVVTTDGRRIPIEATWRSAGRLFLMPDIANRLMAWLASDGSSDPFA